MKKCLFLFCLFTCPFIFGQNHKIDSLLNLIKTGKEDTNKVIHLYKTCQEYILISEFDKGLVFGKQALVLAQNLSFKKGIAQSYNNIGIIYMYQGNYPESLKNHFASLNIKKEIKDKYGVASSYSNIGNIYANQGNYPEALKNHYAGLKINEEINDKKDIATSYNNIGVIYMKKGDLQEALKNQFASLKIDEELKDNQAIATSCLNIGDIYTKLNKIKEAKEYFDKALKLSIETGYKEAIKSSYAGLTIIDSIIGNYKAAFEHDKLHIIYRDSLNNEETQKKSLQASMQYEFDKKEIATKAEQDKLDAINAEEKQKQRVIIYAVAGLLILVGVFAAFMFNRFRITQKQKQVIEEQKVLVDKAYETLHEKNKEVMDSIRYAKRIQTALITSDKYINNALNKLMKN